MPESMLLLYRTRPHRGSARHARRSQWRWRLTDARNNRVLAASSEGYRDRADLVRNIARVTGLHVGLFICGLDRARYTFALSDVIVKHGGGTRVDRRLRFYG